MPSPASKSRAETSETPLDPYDPAPAKKTFSRLGFGMSAIWVIWLALTVVLRYAIKRFFPGWNENPWFYLSAAELPLYLCAVPCGMLIMRKAERAKLERHKLPPRLFFVYFTICQFFLTAGNMLGLAVNAIIERLFGAAQDNPIAALVDSTSLLPRLVFLVILAPLMEEFIFRRQLIDRMKPYGEKLAVALSALMFGLFHGNFSQAFYAFAIGLVFGYLYIRSGKLRYTVILHMIINFSGGIVAPYLQEKAGLLTASMNYEELAEELSENITAMIPVAIYGLIMFSLAIAGLVLFLTRRKKMVFLPTERQIPAGLRFRTAVLNPGMLLFILISAAMFVMHIFS